MALKSQVFTTSTDWPVPVGVSAVWINASAAGGGGGGNAGHAPLSWESPGYAGGGAGEFCQNTMMPVAAGGTLVVIVGSGGIGIVTYSGSPPYIPGTAGGSTQFDSLQLLGGNVVRSNQIQPQGAKGGGFTGGRTAGGGTQEDGLPGTACSLTCFGGSSGGSSSGGGKAGKYGGYQIGLWFGEVAPPSGPPGNTGSGSVGGNTAWSNGGTGGQPGNNSGYGWDGTLGAGGGGGSGTGTPPLTEYTRGGTGGNGFVQVFWSE